MEVVEVLVSTGSSPSSKTGSGSFWSNLVGIMASAWLMELLRRRVLKVVYCSRSSTSPPSWPLRGRRYVIERLVGEEVLTSCPCHLHSS